MLELGSKIQSEVRSEIDKSQREYFLRQQLKAIQQELGETDEQEAEVNELRSQARRSSRCPRTSARRPSASSSASASIQPAERRVPGHPHLPRLDRRRCRGTSRPTTTSTSSTPARSSTTTTTTSRRSRTASSSTSRCASSRATCTGPILCFVGPPGVGKTSLGRSIAEALGRKFVRITVGGVRDEAEIRGHRRTYIGALPGIIIRAMRDAGTDNPVFMIDEIDKMGADFRGDPSSAMLEVLDPEQNHTFRDHYLDLPFDLSKVMFITTANLLDPIPGPLRDRMEIIQLAGYTDRGEAPDRAQLPGAAAARRPTASSRARSTFDDAALREIITEYTREAGVRNLEREIGTICRKVARKVAEDGNGAASASRSAPSACTSCSGGRAFFAETKRRTSRRRRRHRPRLDAGRRRHPVHRGDGRCRATGTSPSPASSAT